MSAGYDPAFDVSRKKSIAALEAAMVKDQMVFLVAQKDPDEEDPKQEDLYTAGAMAKGETDRQDA